MTDVKSKKAVKEVDEKAKAEPKPREENLRNSQRERNV